MAILMEGCDMEQDDAYIRDITRRLQTVQGHVRGVEQMVASQGYCIDVLRQIRAIQGGLDKVASRVLDHHLHACVTLAVQGKNAAAREKVLEELLQISEEKPRK
jgi:DNA-binding FrmR family transcriptional regulator